MERYANEQIASSNRGTKSQDTTTPRHTVSKAKGTRRALERSSAPPAIQHNTPMIVTTAVIAVAAKKLGAIPDANSCKNLTLSSIEGAPLVLRTFAAPVRSISTINGT